jgi:hypothetical protein
MTAAAARPQDEQNQRAKPPPAWLLTGSSLASLPSGRDDSAPPASKRHKDGDNDGDKTMTAVEGAAKGGGKGGKGKSKGHRGGRRGRRGANHTDKKWTSKDANMQSLLSTLCKLTLQNTFKLRMMAATIIDTFTVGKDHEVVQKLEAVLAEYRKAVEAARPSGIEALQKIGGPVASLVVGLLESLMRCDIGGKSKKDIAAYLDGITPAAPGVEPVVTRMNIELDVAAIRVEKCHDDSRVKIPIAAPQWPMRGVVTHAFISEGRATRHTGPAPPGWLEDELASWLDVLSK